MFKSKFRVSLQISLIVILSGLVLGGPVAAQSFGSAFDGVGNNDEPIQIEADKLEIIDNENTALLTGNVSVVQGTTIMKARQIKVYYVREDQAGQTASGIKKIEASGRVAVRSEDNLATADEATVDMVSEIVVMSGNVLLSQGTNVAKGCTVTVNLKTNVSEIKPCPSAAGNGRVKILLDPKSRTTN